MPGAVGGEETGQERTAGLVDSSSVEHRGRGCDSAAATHLVGLAVGVGHLREPEETLAPPVGAARAEEHPVEEAEGVQDLVEEEAALRCRVCQPVHKGIQT